ncbi:concanavalin A-like lectin/glucanase domain-containing protein [Cercophora newfieldiana]|uniref:Crh-like protein n=1 Tax=Cercophora newfieldiana TaxID=92897 RepID=A0AA39XWH5_9PEZI|nr:concanavalin A-like lectin/glucanase domain-containing protein [Cercophora newfieldiana]
MLSQLLTVAVAATAVTAQTFSKCDPTKKDCPFPKALGSKIIDHDFTKGATDFIKDLDGTKIEYDGTNGAVYSIKEPSNAPTTESDKYIFFGQVDITMKAAPGAGIVTSIVLESDDLDEVDWEWVGGDNTKVQTNYFSKGCTETYDRGGFTPVSSPLTEYHTYTLKWTREKLEWIINGQVVRTLNSAGLSGCAGYPQTPMRVKLGSWVAGKEGNSPGTIEWSGGLANFANAPFNAYYKSIRVQDFMGGGGAKEATEYQYTDRSGTWQSIKVVNDGKAVDNSDDKSTTTSATKSATKTGSTTLSTSTTGSIQPSGSGSANSPAGETNPTGTGSGSGSGSASQTTPGGSAPTSAAGKAVLSLGSVFAASLLYFVL